MHNVCQSNRQLIDLKGGNFGEKTKLYGTSEEKEKKTFGREIETDKEKRESFQWTEEIVEHLLNSLKRCKVMCSHFWKGI